MKINEIREMTTDEIKKRIIDEGNNFLDLKFSHKLKQLTNTAKLRELKKDIAKFKTVLHERELGIERKTKKGIN
ncbi:MAG: 50S ribosomal protein L29 [Ignavibacterium sp.]